jgi:hypothetical protein
MTDRPAQKGSVLFVSIDFPPARTSGIYRPVFFSKYLIEAGWRVTLLTAATHLSTVEDASLSGKIHPELEIIRASAPMPRRLTGKIYQKLQNTAGGPTPGAGVSLKTRLYRIAKKLILSPAFRLLDNFVLIPDNYIIWSAKNLFMAYRIIKKNRVSHLLVTSPPQSVQILGLILKYLTGVAYVTDFRNSWTDNQPYRYKIRERLEKWLERKVLKNSRAIINMSPGDVDRLLARLPHIPREKLHVITNGYNEKDFAALTPAPDADRTGPLRLVYVGSMYTHSGDSTAEALRLLAGQGYGPDAIELTVIGFSDESFDHRVEQYGIGHLVRNLGFMNHDDLLAVYPQFDILYLLTGGTPYYHVGALPGKIFEYMRLGKPVLHAGIDGTTHRMLMESGVETFVPLADAGGIAAALIDLMKRKRVGALTVQPNWEYIRSYEWRRLAAKADAILTAVR